MKNLVFDMDGTIANTYEVKGWLEMLRAENPKPYIEAKPMWDMEKLAEVLNKFRANGGLVIIVTWLSMDSTEEYKDSTRAAKLEWLKKWGFPYDHFHGVQYGTTKANCVRRYIDEGILFDDNAKIREGWHLGEAINPCEVNIIKFIEKIL